jgi:hypothetical protein
MREYEANSSARLDPNALQRCRDLSRRPNLALPSYHNPQTDRKAIRLRKMCDLRSLRCISGKIKRISCRLLGKIAAMPDQPTLALMRPICGVTNP